MGGEVEMVDEGETLAKEDGEAEESSASFFTKMGLEDSL
jgi:hypothetical protein